MFNLVILLLSFSCGFTVDRDSTDFPGLIKKLEGLDLEARQQVVDVYLDTLSAAPVIEGSLCHFVFQGDVNRVQVAGDFSFWSPARAEFTNIEGTDFWYLTEEFPLNARFDYKIVTNGQNWLLDPLNPVQIMGGFGPNSELAMPNYIPPSEIIENPETPKGTITNESLLSVNTGATYSIRVYTPPNYDSQATYPSVYFQDGDEYISLGSAQTIIDNLIANGSIEPVVGVFVVPTNRNVEYAGDDRFKYRDFFVSELVPFIESNYSVNSTAQSRAVLGDSYGGNISAIIAFSRPDVFGNCGLHSGAFQEFEYETNDLVTEAVRDVKVASTWGSYEGALTNNMQVIRDHFIENDYDLFWEERSEGHSWGLWRATIDDMLIHFFPKE